MRKILCFFQGSLESPSALENNFFNIFDFCDNSSLSENNVILKIIDAKAEPPYFKHHPPSPHHEVEISKLHKSLVTKIFVLMITIYVKWYRLMAKGAP